MRRFRWQRRVIRGIEAGRHHALAELYDRCGPTVYGHCLARTGTTSAATLVTEMVFVHVWRHPEVLSTGRSQPLARLLVLAARWSVPCAHLIESGNLTGDGSGRS